MKFSPERHSTNQKGQSGYVVISFSCIVAVSLLHRLQSFFLLYVIGSRRYLHERRGSGVVKRESLRSHRNHRVSIFIRRWCGLEAALVLNAL